jgi:hypothetical protein
MKVVASVGNNTYPAHRKETIKVTLCDQYDAINEILLVVYIVYINITCYFLPPDDQKNLEQDIYGHFSLSANYSKRILSNL